MIYARRPKPKATPHVTPISTPVPAVGQVTQLPTVKFTDITVAAGLNFTHFNAASPEKLLPETMGAGAAFLDFDNDGDQDLLLLNGKPWPWVTWGGPLPTLKLYANDGSGRFSDVTAGSGLDVSVMGMGAAVGDFDNDGLADVFVTGTGSSHLFAVNDGVDAYPGCAAAQNESGPELFYRLDLSTTTSLRVLLFDRGTVDVDVHLLSGTSGDDCVDRDHQDLSVTLSPGTHFLSVDTFVESGGQERAGEYIIAIFETP